MTSNGQTALVTGASLGIGRGTALALAKRGAPVAVNYLQHSDAAVAVMREIQSHGGSAMTVQADVTDPEQVQQMLTEIEAQLGTPQIVVASAGASIRHDIFETTADHLRWTFESIVIGTFNVLQVAAKRLVAKRLPGSFLVMGSIHARVPFANALAYNAAKAALHQLTSTFAAELLQHNIRVNVLVPGLTDTPGERRFRTEEELLLVAEQMPMGRMATVEEIGQLAAYLVSSENAYMTGSVVSADGGLEVSLGLAG